MSPLIEATEYGALAFPQHDRLGVCRYLVVELHRGTAKQHAHQRE